MRALRDYQREGLDRLVETFGAGHRRATLVMPCGTGKTVVFSHLLRRRGGQSVVFVPTVALLVQTMQSLGADNPDAALVAVCSPTAVDDGDLPQSTVLTSLGVGATTDPEELRELLAAHPRLLVVATYASSPVVAEASAGRSWSTVVCDEAHRTAGMEGRAWSLPVSEEALAAEARLFVTATPRVVVPPEEGDVPPELEEVRVVSMDSVEVYGPHIAPMTLREAIEGGHLEDYRVVVVGVTAADVLRRMVTAVGDNDAAPSPLAAATQLAVLHARQTHPHVRSVLAFHNRIADSRQWSAQFRQVAKAVDGGDVEVFHVDAGSAPAWRTRALRALESPGGRTVVVSNCRLFGEGVDVPALDAVLFAAPRTSAVDIVQVVGRALRRHPSRRDEPALVVLPVLVDGGENDALAAVARSTHMMAWQVLMSMSEVDEQVHESVVRHQMVVAGEATPVPPTVAVDASMLSPGDRGAFALRTLSPVTAHHPVTVAKLREHLRVTGSASPGSSLMWGEYPLGARVAAARRAHAAGRLPARLAALYEAVPGFQWVPTRRSLVDAERWVGLAELYVQRTGVRSIASHHTVIDPDSGQSFAVGKKLHDFRWVRGLDEELRQRLRALRLSPPPPGLGETPAR